MNIKQSIKYIIRKYHGRDLPVRWIKRADNGVESGRLNQIFKKNIIRPQTGQFSRNIERFAEATNSQGEQPLWEGYEGNNIGGSTRMPNGVRTAAAIGDLYTQLVSFLQPAIIVEFGTAFGVSGMYFLAGIRQNGQGKLLTFEPNTVWAGLARKNLEQISDQFELTINTFESSIDSVLPVDAKIDLAFIDAIHTREFVLPQLELVIGHSRPGAILILDDINFSDDMRQCWEEVSADERFVNSVEVAGRIGIVELGGP